MKGESVVHECPICGKRFIPSPAGWVYKRNGKMYCRYKCYREAGGDSGAFKNRPWKE